MGIRKLGFSIASTFDIHVKFLNLFFFDLLDEFTTLLLVLLPPPLITLLLPALNAFGANSLYNSIILNIKISNIAILLKS